MERTTSSISAASACIRPDTALTLTYYPSLLPTVCWDGQVRIWLRPSPLGIHRHSKGLLTSLYV